MFSPDPLWTAILIRNLDTTPRSGRCSPRVALVTGQAVSPRDQDLVRVAKLQNLRLLGTGGSPMPHVTEAGITAFRKLRFAVGLTVNEKRYPPVAPEPPPATD